MAEKIIIPTNKIAVSGVNLPYEKTSIIIVTKNINGNDAITPEISPLNSHFFDAINPVTNEPIDTEPIKYIVVEFVNADDLDKIKDATSVNIIIAIKPTQLANKIPIIFLVDTDISFFRLAIFLCIEKSLTFNKEYEGLNIFMI